MADRVHFTQNELMQHHAALSAPEQLTPQLASRPASLAGNAQASLEPTVIPETMHPTAQASIATMSSPVEAAREAELRRELVRFGKWLHRMGFMPGTSGNLSVRLDGERLLATPTGASKYLLRAADMVILDYGGRQISGSRKVTSEIGMHLAIYRARPDIHAIIHSHPPIATAFACAGRALDETLCQEAIMTLGTVPLASYATTGTYEVAASLAPHVADHDAILMANHGAVTYGPNVLDAFLKMETLEHLAHIRLVAHHLGTPRALTPLELEKALLAKARYNQNSL